MTITADTPASVKPSTGAAHNRLKAELGPTNDHRGRGRPSSWSSAIDALAAGTAEEPQRLIVLSAGNTINELRQYYPDLNVTESIHDPAQAWNALTVGAFTDKTTFDAARYPGWTPLAPRGGLSPSSTTSMVWDEQWPIKPDVVLEGGNLAKDPANPTPQDIDDLKLLSTDHDLAQRSLDAMADTSAAAALGARMAAIIHAEYPVLRPETIRALMVHSAEWTPAMLNGKPIAKLEGKRVGELLRTYGFGVPELGPALWSARDALTLVVEDEIQPFAEHGGKLTTDMMRLHKLPWPTDALSDLGKENVELRVTLSYFIEPSPGERGWGRRYAYASHGLRLHMQTPEETLVQFKKRVSKAMRDGDSKAETKADHHKWLLGPTLRHRGSLHSDRWFGSAADLAKREHLAISPIYGWWLDRPQFNRSTSKAHYALIVSIRAKGVEVDLYTPVATQIGVAVPT